MDRTVGVLADRRGSRDWRGNREERCDMKMMKETMKALATAVVLGLAANGFAGWT